MENSLFFRQSQTDPFWQSQRMYFLYSYYFMLQSETGSVDLNNLVFAKPKRRMVF